MGEEPDSFMYVLGGIIAVVAIGLMLFKNQQANKDAVGRDSLFMRDAQDDLKIRQKERQQEQEQEKADELVLNAHMSKLLLPHQDRYQLVLQSTGNRKLAVLKETKEMLGIDLKSAKEIVDDLPQVIMKGVSKERVLIAYKCLLKVGAVVKIS